MQHLTTTLAAALRSAFAAFDVEEVAEGVISTAIAVLILAFVGAAMWVGFDALTSSTCDAVAAEVQDGIGAGGSSNISCDG